jgi:hypothetical protein
MSTCVTAFHGCSDIANPDHAKMRAQGAERAALTEKLRLLRRVSFEHASVETTTLPLQREWSENPEKYTQAVRG